MELQRRAMTRTMIVLVTAVALMTTAFGVSTLLKPQTANAAQSIPYKVNFQGRLTDNNGNILADGLYNIKFRFWDALTSGTNKYEEDRTITGVDNRIQVTNGLFNIQFGDVTALSPALFSGAYPLYLEVELPTPATATCATNGCAVFTEGAMTPRQPLASSPYAFNADTLDGNDSTAFAQLGSLSNTFTGTNIFQPTTNIPSVLIKQNSSGSFAQDVFDVSGSSSGNFIQVTSTAANQGAVTVQSLGANALTLQSGNGTISLGSTTLVNSTGASLAINSAAGTTLALDSGTTGAIQIGGGTTSAKTITIGPAATDTNTTTYQIGINAAGTQSITIGSAGQAADAVSIESGSTGTLAIGNGGTAHTIQIGTGAAIQNVTIGSKTSSSTTTVNGGTGNIILANNAAGSGVIVAPGTNSATAFQVQNASAVPIFLIDTTTSLSGNYLTNGGFELGAATPTGWAAVGAPTTFARNTAAPNHYGGVASLQLVTTATAGQGATTTLFNSAPGSGTYTLSFYAEVTAGSAASTDFQTSVNGGASVACTAGVTLVSTGFKRISCPVTAGATVTSVSITQSTAAARTLYIDAVQLVSGGTATPATGAGAIQLRGAVDAPVVFQALSNSTTAFQIQNSAGTSNLFDADTLNGFVGIGTLSPAAKLDVNGTANATGFSVASQAGQAATISCAANQAVTTATFTGGILTTAPTCNTITGTGASTSLGNLGVTAINLGLIPAINNNIDLGTSAAAWKNLYVANIDTGTSPTALTIGINNAASIQIGKNTVGVGIPGGITTSGGTINTGSGSITTSGTLSAGGITGTSLGLGSGNITTTGSIGGGAITGTSLSAGAGSVTGGQINGTNGVFTNSTNALLLGTTNTAQLNVTGSSPQVYSLAAGGTICTTTVTTCNAFYQAAGNYLVQGPASSAANTITVTSATVSGLIVQGATSNSVPVAIIKGGTTPAADLFDVQNVGGTNLVKVDNAGNLGVGLGATAAAYPVDIVGKLRSSTGYILGADASVIAVTGGQSAVSTWWGLQLVGNKQSAVDYTVANYGGAGDFSVIIPNQQAASIGLVVRGQTAQTGDLEQWQNQAGTSLARISPTGAFGSSDSTTATTGSVAIRSGNATTGAGLNSGSITIDSGTATGTAGAILIGNSAVAKSITLGNLTGATTTALQGGTGAGAISLTTGATGSITVTPGTGGIANSFGAGVTDAYTATAVMTADMISETNTSATNAPTADGINLLQQTYFAKPSGTNTDSSTRINVTNANTGTGGQVNGLRIVATGTGGAIASDTDGIFIDPLTNNSTGTTNENAIEIGSNWDAGLWIQSGGNTIQATSATALVAESATNVVSLSVNTSAGIVNVGSGTADATQILLQLDSYAASAGATADTATCNTTTNQGAIYYNTTTAAIRGCVNGGWEDVVTTSGLGLITFGVVPDSGTGGGDIGSITSNDVNGPCKVSLLTTTTVKIVQGCSVYSGGRKIIVPDNTTPTGTLTFTNGNTVHVCMTTAGTNQPAFSTSGTEFTNLPTFSVNNPIVCLADIKTSATVITSIFDVRPFTTTTKEFTTVANSAAGLGFLVANYTAANEVTATNTAAQAAVRGVVDATTGGTSTTTINAIITVKGLHYVKAVTGTALNINYMIEGTGTAGYVTAVIGTTAISNFAFGGLVIKPNDTTCSTSNTCQYSALVDFSPSR